ncbi:tachylectin-related carbohydrate-binding protein [Actinoalloteichus sp. GBA129-24]|uniref:tachylectin-related carbohydrate-binding protein n=1 Tax=Actinoalloteichus sp. GBA129-24 TaxID=1612551 RepID=UPI00095055FF|nr:tachylectin-related carbohydrate-binding protein [Actinoalloteichus sp. GBA129-24]APU23433.1 Tachylectin [Actinoalloteichus sp. GBA129-24]
MHSVGMPRRSTSALTLLLVLAATTFAPTPAVAQNAAEDDPGTRSCLPTANIFTHGPDRSIRLAEQHDVLADSPSWGPQTPLSPLWSGTPVGLPDGGFLQVYANGQLRYMELDGRAWRANPNGLRYRVVAEQGWDHWARPANRDQITADDQGLIFAVDGEGALTTSLFDRRNDSWSITGDVIDTGWDQYDRIFAGGDGVLYAQRPDTALFRFQYHHPSQRWLEYAQPAGHGWDYSHLFSIGADLVYGVDEETGDLVSHRWDRETDDWETGENFRKVVGTGWSGYQDITADGAACTYDSSDLPGNVAPENDRSQAIMATEDASGLLRLYFTESSGRLFEAWQRYPYDPTYFGYTLLDRGPQFVGQPSAVQRSNGETSLVGQRTDSSTWGASRVDGDWSTFSPLGGWTPGPAQLVETADGSVTAFAVTEDGRLLHREQDGALGAKIRWWPLGGSNLTSDFTVVEEGDQIQVVVRDDQGTYQLVTVEDGTPSVWTALPGDGFEGRPSLTIDSTGQWRLFARGGDDRIHELRESTLSAGWAPVGDRTFVGSPAAVNRAGDRTTVVARGADDYLWVAVQDALDDSLYGGWTQLVDRRTGQAYPATGDAAVLRDSSGYLVISFLGIADELYVFRSAYSDTIGVASEPVPSAGEEGDEPLAEFDGGPVELTEVR